MRTEAPALVTEKGRAMTPCKSCGWLAWFLVLVAAVALAVPDADSAPKTETPAADLYGDELPDGATARLGTLRLRQGSAVVALAFAPDGRTLASSGTYRLRLWHLPDGEALDQATLGIDGFQQVAFAHDGKSLAAVYDHQGRIRLYNLRPAGADGKASALGTRRANTADSRRPLVFLTFLPGDKEILSLDDRGHADVWDAVTGKRARGFGGDDRGGFGTGAVSALAADGRTLAVATQRRGPGGRGGRGPGGGGPGGPGGPGGRGMAGRDDSRDLVLWDVTEGVQLDIRPTARDIGEGAALAFSPDGETLAIADTPDTIRLWDATGHKDTVTLSVALPPERGRAPKNTFARSLTFTPDGQALVSLGRGVVRIWDVATGKERTAFKGWNHDIQTVALSADGRTLAASGEDGMIQVCDLATGEQRDDLSQMAVGAVAVTPDGKHVALAAADGVVRLWECETGKFVRAFRGHEREPTALAFTPHGKELISTSLGDATRKWNVATGKETAMIPAVEEEARLLRAYLTPDGKTLARPLRSGTQIVDVATGTIEQTIAGSAVLSPDGRLIAGVFKDQVRVLETATGKVRWSRDAGNEDLLALAFSPDQRQLGGLTSAGMVRWWDAGSGRQIAELKLQDNDATVFASAALAFSPDGRMLAVGNLGAVVLCESASGQVAQRLEGHTGFVQGVCFTPDGRSLISASSDTTALVWDLTGRAARKRRAAPTAAELEARWGELLGDRGEDAQAALLCLANAPRQAVPLMRTRLLGNPADAQAVATWLANLDDDRYEVREKASAELARLGKTVEAELRETARTTKSAEVRRRTKALLAKLGGDRITQDLGAQRVVAVLELAATPEAKTLLEELAKTAASEQLRRHAKAALERLNRAS